MLAGLSHDALTVTDDLAPRLLGLPVAPDLDADSVSRIVAIVADIVARQQALQPAGDDSHWSSKAISASGSIR